MNFSLTPIYNSIFLLSLIEMLPFLGSLNDQNSTYGLYNTDALPDMYIFTSSLFRATVSKRFISFFGSLYKYFSWLSFSIKNSSKIIMETSAKLAGLRFCALLSSATYPTCSPFSKKPFFIVFTSRPRSAFMSANICIPFSVISFQFCGRLTTYKNFLPFLIAFSTFSFHP